jgi:hypothetical protein
MSRPAGRVTEKLPSNCSAGSEPLYTLHGRKAKKEIPVFVTRLQYS